MRKADFALQTLLLGIIPGSMIVYGFEGLFIALYVQFFIGCYQLISGVVKVGTIKYHKPLVQKHIKIYWVLVLVYFLMLGLLGAVGNDEVVSIWLFGPPWLLAIYFYVLTILETFGPVKQKKRSTFLPNINL